MACKLVSRKVYLIAVETYLRFIMWKRMAVRLEKNRYFLSWLADLAGVSGVPTTMSHRHGSGGNGVEAAEHQQLLLQETR